MATRICTFREEALTSTANCPIGLDPIAHPVKVTCCNQFFEKENLKQWVRGHHTCPCCRATLSMPDERGGRNRPFTYRRIVNPPPRRLPPRPLARPCILEPPTNQAYSTIVSLCKYFLLGAVSMLFMKIKISGIIAYPISAIAIGWINWQSTIKPWIRKTTPFTIISASIIRLTI